MIEVGKLYEPFSEPLKIIDKPSIGEIYYNTEGHALLCLGDDEYRFLRTSELTYGEIVEALNERQLSLFWILTKNRPKFSNAL